MDFLCHFPLYCVILSLLGCASSTEIREEIPLHRGRCGHANDQRAWVRNEAPPLNAASYRAIAVENRIMQAPWTNEPEYWFSVQDRLMLCRAEGTPNDASVGEWWEFSVNATALPVLVDRSAWVIVM